MTSVPFSPSRRGRPPKYGRPSRAVTLTLPEDVIAALARLDEDLGRAVVRIAQPLVADVVPHAPAELSNYGDSAVIITRRLSSLARIRGVTLVPLPDGRALISLDGTISVSDFELKLRDMVDDGSPLDDGTQTGGVENLGLRVAWDGSPFAGKFVAVTGISSSYKGADGYIRRLLRVRSADDIQVIDVP